jgi:hypothetical protein
MPNQNAARWESRHRITEMFLTVVEQQELLAHVTC